MLPSGAHDNDTTRNNKSAWEELAVIAKMHVGSSGRLLIVLSKVLYFTCIIKYCLHQWYKKCSDHLLK